MHYLFPYPKRPYTCPTKRGQQSAAHGCRAMYFWRSISTTQVGGKVQSMRALKGHTGTLRVKQLKRSDLYLSWWFYKVMLSDEEIS